MTSAYPDDHEKRTPTPKEFDKFRKDLKTHLAAAAFSPADYALDRQLGIPVTLHVVFVDTYWKSTQVDDVVRAFMLYPELMEMDFLKAMEMPITLMNGPLRCALGYTHDGYFKPSHRREVLNKLSIRYREGIDARHPRETR